MPRTATVTRNTRETQIRLELNLDGSGQGSWQTGVGFLDHMLELFTRHGAFDLKVEAKGDLQVDQHHTGHHKQPNYRERALAQQVKSGSELVTTDASLSSAVYR